MTDHLKQIIVGQFEASLSMLRECIQSCPPEHWDGKIAKYTFWQVVYHTLCFVDCYLSRGEACFQPRIAEGIHPAGLEELGGEYPSRRFEKAEMLAYVAICRDKLRDELAADTRESLEGPSGFSWLVFSRAEGHLYNIRHVQHHTGQLSAYLRRVGVETKWVKTGWKE